MKQSALPESIVLTGGDTRLELRQSDFKLTSKFAGLWEQDNGNWLGIACRWEECSPFIVGTLGLEWYYPPGSDAKVRTHSFRETLVGTTSDGGVFEIANANDFADLMNRFRARALWGRPNE